MAIRLIHAASLLTFLSVVPLGFSFSPIHTTAYVRSTGQPYARYPEMPLHLKATESEEATTTQDPLVESPASLVYYDDTEGVVCARGVCVLDEKGDIFIDDDDKSFLDKILNSYLGPRLFLGGASVLYGTNFALGSLMNDAMPPSAATAARTVMAALALSPFLFQLNPALAGSAVLCGCFTALGYITQAMSLVDTSPATVSFIGAAVVLVCPVLEFFVDKKPLGLKEAPQVWLAASLCLLGVGVLELYDPVTGAIGVGDIGFGDFLALLQAVGFGTSFFLTERMMRGRPDQALPITAVQVSMSALLCMVWCFANGWMDLDGASQYFMPNMFFEPTLQHAAWAVAWTGLITTAMNRVVETTALGKVSSAEASVILATEPLFAAFFSALLLHEQFGLNDYVGGVLIVGACFATALKPADLKKFIPK
jgi:drug/metabolite transporter (DMT)-like permease